MAHLYVLKFASGKRYVGITNCGISGRMKEHDKCANKRRSNLPVYNAWRKHGIPEIEFSVEGPLGYLQLMEIKFIKELATRIPEGYNVAMGGQISPSKSPEVRAKISIARKGSKATESAKLAMSAAQRERFKRPDQLAATSTAATGPRTLNWNENISAALKGRTSSAEHRSNLSKALTGKSKSIESIEKMRRSKTGKSPSESSRIKLSHSNALAWAKKQGRAFCEVKFSN